MTKRSRRPKRLAVRMDETGAVFPSIYEEYWFGLVFWI
jgi:hypothetical protein